jgi:hypothetical protein
MERAIGDVFEYENLRFKVVRAEKVGSCQGCAGREFLHDSSLCTKGVGKCSKSLRSDGKSIIVVELKD